MEYLTQKELKEMFLFSAKKIDEEKEEINKINVFPVPDQDTGTNLAKTLLGIKEAIEKKEFKNLEEFVQSVLEGALVSAQGNAGVIYTGFLAGFLPVLNKEPINAKVLAEAFESGRKKAWNSMLDPKEGTILDVIDATAEAFKSESKNEKNIIKIFEKVVQKAKEALLATREKMEIFKKANVVDAGGLGFLMILESYLTVLNPSLSQSKFKKEKASEEIKKFIQVLANRYEVVALIFNPTFNEEKIKEKLKKLGNCLDIIRVGEKMKIHIHTDYPDEVRDYLKKIGKIENLRIEDMVKEVIKEPSVRTISVGIVIEDITCLPKKILDRYQIEQVSPVFDWFKIKSYEGENTLQNLQKIENGKVKIDPKDSHSLSVSYFNCFKRQLQKFEKVLCLTVSSKLSVSYNSAVQAKEMLNPEEKKRVFILDTLQAIAGQALLVLRAIELIQEQKEIDEIIRDLKVLIPKTNLYILLENPRWLKGFGIITSSQVKWTRRVKKIGIHPLIKLKNGIMKKGGMVFAKDDVGALFKKINKESKKERKKGMKIRAIINHGNTPEKAESLKKMLKEIGIEVSFVSPGPEIFGILGLNYIVVGWQPLE